MKTKKYKTTVTWTGNTGTGTVDYKNYERSHTIQVLNKAPLQASSDPDYRGDATKLNPEELFVSALSSCHMLWYLHLCADNGIVVISYEDNATGELHENTDGSGQFTEVILYPKVQVTKSSSLDKAIALHEQAHIMCFIARSCNFPVNCKPVCIH